MTFLASRCRARLLARLAALLLLLPLATGCAVGRYAGDRLMDLTDIIDVKYGVAIGVGAKAEITQFLGTGAGVAALGYSREWYGRRSVEMNGWAFIHLVAIGVDGGYGSPNPGGWSNERAEVYFLLVNSTAFADFGIAPGGDARWEHIPKGDGSSIEGRPEPRPDAYEPFNPLDYWRFGAEVLIPGVQFGIYFNFGQVIDFVAGLGTFDPAEDDGVSFFDTYNIPWEESAEAIQQAEERAERAAERN